MKKIIIMEIKSSQMPKFDRQNRESIHMHTYIFIYYSLIKYI